MGARFLSAFLLLAVMFWVTGCKRATPSAQQATPTAVPVSHAVERPVTDYVEYTGRLDAVQAVGIKARATGFLEPIPKDVKEGAEVEAGKLLFQIDPRPYKAQYEQAASQVDIVKAQLKLANVTLERAKTSLQKNVGSKQDVDQAEASVEEAKARIKSAEATVETYRLNLEFTKVTAPIAGQISRFYFTPGNLIVQDQTLLTTIVSMDPMYAYFDVDERTVLRIRGEISAGKVKPPSGETKVFMALEGETEYPHQGHVDFVNNVINPATGTVSVRGVFANPKPAIGKRLLSPGMFVRIRLPIGEPHVGRLVVDRAIGSDQGLKYVYIVDAKNKIQYRRVQTGPLQDDGLRVIEKGIEPTDRVVVGSLPQLRPDMEVTPEEVAMPIPGAPSVPDGKNPDGKTPDVKTPDGKSNKK